MKLRIYSDLHREFAGFEAPPGDYDLVILAGDIDRSCRGVEWANESFPVPVLYVCGNHEFYGGHIEHTLRKMQAAAKPHVHVLENQSFEFHGARFLCCTAWTDYSATGDVTAASSMAWEWMNDFRKIKAGAGYRRLRPADVVAQNQVSHSFLKRELDRKFDGRSVVITHHAPCIEVVGDKHDGHLNAAYANRWHGLMPLADLWVFGHTHTAVDETYGGCRVVSNPGGYPGEETGFNAFLDIEI